jgi:hypothetical protein
MDREDIEQLKKEKADSRSKPDIEEQAKQSQKKT